MDLFLRLTFKQKIASKNGILLELEDTNLARRGVIRPIAGLEAGRVDPDQI